MHCNRCFQETIRTIPVAIEMQAGAPEVQGLERDSQYPDVAIRPIVDGFQMRVQGANGADVAHQPRVDGGVRVETGRQPQRIPRCVRWVQFEGVILSADVKMAS
jgi:hypothetical protein